MRYGFTGTRQGIPNTVYQPQGPSLANQLREALDMKDSDLKQIMLAAIERINKLKELTCQPNP